MKRRGRAAALALALVLVLGVLLVTRHELRGGQSAPPGSNVSPTGLSAPTGPPTPGAPTSGVPPPTLPAPLPPPGTIHVSSRYLSTYGATRASWQDLIDQGKPLPAVTARCAEGWRTSGKDRRLQQKSVRFLCLDAVSNIGFRPQGIAGSATTQHYRINRVPAATRHLLLISWYSRLSVPGLLAPNHPGQSVTRLVVLDLDSRRYNSVELVRPVGRDRFGNLNSHGSGLAWAGQYLYSSSHAQLWMYNADDLLKVSGRFVLPAVAHWKVSGAGGLSSISLDRSARPAQLRGINYSTRGQAYVSSFALADDGLLRPNRRRTPHDLILANDFGQPGRVVHSASSRLIAGTNFQGVATAGRYTFANSSGLALGTADGQGVDAVAVLKGTKVMATVRMPRGVESVYLDYRRRTYYSMVEGGSQFLFAIPLRQLRTWSRSPIR